MDSINKKSNIFFNIMLIITMIVFVFRNTLLSQLDNTLSISINLSCFFLCILLFLKNYSLTKKFDLKEFVKGNWIWIIYFSLRILTFIIKGFDIKILNNIFMEFFLLIIFFRGITLNGNNPKKLLKYAMIIISVMCLFFMLRALYCVLIGNNFFNALLYSLAFNINGKFFNVNANAMGVLVMFITSFSLSYFDKKNKWFYIMFVIAILYLFLTGCRSAMVGITAVIISYVCVKLFKRVNAKKTMLAWLLLSFFYLFALFTCSVINKDMIVFNSFEQKWNKYSSIRYMLDKYTILSLKDDFLLGFGSFEYTGQKRYDYLMENFPQVVDVRLGADENYANRYKTLHAHNGFLDFIAGNGIICLILFLYFIISKIKDIDDKICMRYYLPIIYMIIISNFENTLLNVVPFMFFLILLFVSCMEYEQLREEQYIKENN